MVHCQGLDKQCLEHAQVSSSRYHNSSSEDMKTDPPYSMGRRTCISSLTLQQCGSSRQVTSAVGSRTNAAKLRRSTRVSDSPSPPAAYATRSPDQVAAKPLCSRRKAVSAHKCSCRPAFAVPGSTDKTHHCRP